MSIITPELAGRIIDRATQLGMRYVGASGQTYGVGVPAGSYGAAVAATALLRDVLESADEHVTDSLTSVARTLKNTNADGLAKAARDIEPIIDALGRHARNQQPAAAVVDLDSYAEYYNCTHATKWQVLFPPYFYDIYLEAKGEAPSRCNIYYEVRQGESYGGNTFTNALGKFVASGAGAGTFTAGFDINATASWAAGGFPWLTMTGITGNGVVTVTGKAFDPATQTVSSGVTWTATVTGDGRWQLAVGTAPANSLIVAVTNITIAAGISAGTIYVESERPVLTTGTATAGGATTITLAATASDLEDYYDLLEVAHSRDQYTIRTANDYNNETKVLTVSVAWATNPQNTDLYRIWRLKLP